MSEREQELIRRLKAQAQIADDYADQCATNVWDTQDASAYSLRANTFREAADMVAEILNEEGWQ